MPAHLPRQAPAYPELTGELHNAVIGFLALTPAQLLAINHEDLTKETAQQNLPGLRGSTRTGATRCGTR